MITRKEADAFVFIVAGPNENVRSLQAARRYLDTALAKLSEMDKLLAKEDNIESIKSDIRSRISAAHDHVRGVKQRPSKERQEDFADQLMACNSLFDISLGDRQIHFAVNDIKLHCNQYDLDLELGNFTVTLRVNDSLGLYTPPEARPQTRYNRELTPHPHVSNAFNICCGDFESEVMFASEPKSLDLVTVMTDCTTILRSYNERSAFNKIPKYFGIPTCRSCGGYTQARCECGASRCESCSRSCVECGNTICYGCMLERNGDYYCAACYAAEERAAAEEEAAAEEGASLYSSHVPIT